MSPTRRWSPREAAAYLGCSPRQILRWCATRELAHERLGPRVIRLRPADVEAFAAARRVSTRRSA